MRFSDVWRGDVEQYTTVKFAEKHGHNRIISARRGTLAHKTSYSRHFILLKCLDKPEKISLDVYVCKVYPFFLSEIFILEFWIVLNVWWFVFFILICLYKKQCFAFDKNKMGRWYYFFSEKADYYLKLTIHDIGYIFQFSLWEPMNVKIGPIVSGLCYSISNKFRIPLEYA